MEKGACLSGPKETCGTFSFPWAGAWAFSFVPSPRINRRSSGMPSGRKPGKRKKEIQKVMDALKQTDTSSMTKKNKRKSPAATDTVTGLIAKRNAAGRYEAGTGICRAETFLQVWTGGTDFRGRCPGIGT